MRQDYLDALLSSRAADCDGGRLVCRQGEQIAIYDGRPNGELFLATGTVEDGNPADCLALKASLVKADRLYSGKKAVLESLGFSAEEVSPLLPWEVDAAVRRSLD